MCGLSLFLMQTTLQSENTKSLLDLSDKISHRGPDITERIILSDLMMTFHRLKINDLSDNGNQPFICEDEKRTVYLLCNGEIYNHKEVVKDHDLKVISRSDCEPIISYYMKYGTDRLNEVIDGEYAFVIVDIDKSSGDIKLYISNDKFGKRPLFIASNSDGVYIASESISIPCDAKVIRFPPRQYATLSKINGIISDVEFTEYYSLRNIPKHNLGFKDSCVRVKELIGKSVRTMIDNSDVPVGAFLSGGLDSFVVCYEAARYLREQGKELNTFSIGFEGSDDQIWAEKAAKFIGSKHTHFVITKDDFKAYYRLIIECLGSFDPTTVRASFGQYMLAKEISKTDIKVWLSGDGSDELMFSYDDAFDCPSKDAFLKRNLELLENIHLYDGLRVDRCVSNFGLEVRIPFLDTELVEFILGCDIDHRISRNRISKPLIRYAYQGLAPDEILFRPKVTFSDGIGSREDPPHLFYQKLFKDCNETIDVIHCKPRTNEETMYRKSFIDSYGANESFAELIPKCWNNEFSTCVDPSAWCHAMNTKV